MESKLNFVSLGYVIKDIEEDKNVIKILPIEMIPNVDGAVTGEADATNSMTMNNSNIHDTVSVHAVNKTNSITATWIAIENSNRITPPNVCKGETVRLFKYSDNDLYYWTTLYNELDLRKKEKVVYAYSNKPTINISPSELMKKTYWYMIDTINKKVALHTDDSDGELTSYDIEIDTVKGLFTVTDGKGNIIQLDSDKSSVNIISKTLNINTENEAIIDTKNLLVNTKNTAIVTKQFSVTNGGTELIATLMEFVEIMMAYKTIPAIPGMKLGGEPPVINKLANIKSKLSKFK